MHRYRLVWHSLRHAGKMPALPGFRKPLIGGLAVAALIAGFLSQGAFPVLAADRAKAGPEMEVKDDYYPDLKKKIVPILTFGSSINIGVAQVQGEESDVDRCKAVAQLETDYKDVARIKILVPVQTGGGKTLDRVPGVSVSAVADYAIKR